MKTYMYMYLSHIHVFPSLMCHLHVFVYLHFTFLNLHIILSEDASCNVTTKYDKSLLMCTCIAICLCNLIHQWRWIENVFIREQHVNNIHSTKFCSHIWRHLLLVPSSFAHKRLRNLISALVLEEWTHHAEIVISCRRWVMV